MPGKDGGGKEIFSETQGPEDLQNRSQPAQGPPVRIGLTGPRQPRNDVAKRLAHKGSCRLAGIQTVSPAAERGGIGETIWVFERRRRLFPGATILKTPSQRLTASQQAVVGVREGKRRQKGECLSATAAVTATDLDPVVMLIVRLLAAATVPDDRIVFTNGASPQDDFGAVYGPVGFELVRRCGKWDKENRSSLGL